MNLRTIALASTALVAIAAVPAQAGQYMGKVNLGLGYAWESYDTGGENPDLEYSTLHGSASVNVPYSDRVNVQVDLFGDASLDQAYDSHCANLCGSFHGGFGAGLHLNYKDPSMGGLGVFGAVGRVNVGGDSSSDGVVFAAGLEGEYYANAWTLSAQAGYLDSDSTIWGLVKNAGFIKAGAAFYPSSKLKLAGNVGYLDGDTQTEFNNNTGTSDVREWNWAFSVEYLFGKSVPVSTYLEYKGRSLEEFSDPTYDLDRHEVRAGVRFYFGGGDDLQKADREGASFESPDLITWAPHEYP